MPADRIRAVLQQRMLDFMDDRSFTDAIGCMSPEVDAFFRCTLTRGTGEPEEIAAGYGIGYFHLVWTRDEGLGRAILGGPQRLMDALAEGIGDGIRYGHRVAGVRRDGDGVVVDYEGPAGSGTIRAGSVIMATPSHRTADLVEGLPEDLDRALRAIRYGPMISAAYLTDEEGPQPWDDIYAIATPKRSMSMVFNMANMTAGVRTERPRGSSFMAYAPANLGALIREFPDEEILDRFQADLEEVLPGVRGHVVERLLHRVDPGVPFPFVGRGRIQPTLMRPTSRIHLAGDYLGSWYAETSAWTGARAAAAAIADGS
jgi:oxygen-dependent protoporphyrinogen oxidase